MKAWSWFAVTPVVFTLAYSVAPMLVTGLGGHNAAAVTITQLELPVAETKPAPKVVDAAGREINYYSFGDLANGGRRSKPVPPEPVLQSILMTDRVGVAIVDGIQVRVGDKVGDGYHIVKIEPRAVWLAIKRTTSAKVGKSIKQVSKNELKVLHFPEYRDRDTGSANLASNSAANPGAQLPVSSGQKGATAQKPEQIELEKNYKQILEKLKL